ncbi:acyl-CoA dehydrogenase family protein [Cryptosporangium phraense]|uniref:Acyl-CoA dehydrogenase n=1 Tax=Cryptosporangium phraense TaxID=2593070 RepID=A0A545B0F0_9ACTN|nr:acyl-CoA dehydrogenase family protein [Cryptosporangium phraense]TQS47063.1 acyl-CoA dehydrogenase [Cryptosporangium phraense]
MDFTLTEAQTELAELTRRIVGDRVTVATLTAAEESGSRFDRALWSVLAETGLLDVEDLAEQCSVLTELGRGLAPVPYLPSVVVARPALARFGSAPARERWLSGPSVLAFALAHPDVRPPAAAGQPDGGWLLSGEVTAVPAAPVADALLVETVGGVFVVAPDDPGVTITRQPSTDLDDAGLLVLNDVSLADDRRLDGPLDIADWLRTRASVARAAWQLGVLDAALEMTAEHARTRTQFGKPIGAFQAVSQRLANAYVDVRAVELTLWAAIDACGSEDDPRAAVATAAFWTAEAGHRVAHTLVHVHGGTGIDVSHAAHRYFLAAKRAEFEGGGATSALLELGSAL